jgi:hypothetical protein
MTKLKVYISSTFLDLELPREIIMERVQKGLKDKYELTNIMEHMKGDWQNRSNIDICLNEVRKADLYIILVGNRYGSHPEEFTGKDGLKKNTEELSYTEIEYDMACDVLNRKFYGIYKMELTDAFFADANLDAKKFAENDEKKINNLKAFSTKLDKTVSNIKINSIAELKTGINDVFTEFLFSYNTKLELNITASDKVSINRNDVLTKVTNMKFGAGAYTLILNTHSGDDCYAEFTLKLQDVLAKKKPDKEKPELIRSNGLEFAEKDKLLTELLNRSSRNIYGEQQNGASFEGLPEDLKLIKNAFIGFVVDSKLDIMPDGFNFMDSIASFIKKIDDILTANKFRFNFYFIIYIENPNKEKLPEDLYRSFTGLKYSDIGELSNVERDHIITWLKDIRERNDIETDEEGLFRLVFLDDNKFPSRYKQCIQLIDKRTTTTKENE